jgi:Carboxypeptidase regulatory-like domain
MTTKSIERDLILEALTPSERDIVLRGVGTGRAGRSLILSGSASEDAGRDLIIKGKNGFGRYLILTTKPAAGRSLILNAVDPPESLVRYSFSEDEIKESLEISSGELVNEITVLYAYDFIDGKPRGAITKHNPLSKLLYGEASKSLELRMVRSARVAEKIADAVLHTSSVPEIVSSFNHDLRSFYLEVGDTVSISHSAGIGPQGFQKALAIVTDKKISGATISYKAVMKSSGRLYRSELVTLTTVAGGGKEGLTVAYKNGVATITIYADVQGNPPVEGAEVTISGVKKVTDKNGQARFNLQPGTYTAHISASGYEDAQVTFSV